PARERNAAFAATAISDICATVARLAVRWRSGERAWRHVWDVMEKAPGTVGEIVAAFRRHNGGPVPLLALPGWSLGPGLIAGDLVALLDWKPPIRSTAMVEMRRGIKG